MADKIENLNLYAVRVRDRVTASHIEARSDEEAVAEAVRSVGDPGGACAIVSKEPVYERAVSVECSDGESESDVFEIKVRGVSADRVDRLAKAIHAFIGGPGMPESDYGKIHSARPLAEAADGMMAFI